MSNGFSSENTTAELTDSPTSIALLVFGGTEQCGPCLPCCVDSLLADYLADQYANLLGAYRTPTFPYNTSQEHASRSGTLSLPSAIMHSVTEQLIVQLAARSIRQFVLLSPHGGSHWEASAIKEINAQYPEITLVSAKDGASESMSAARKEAELESAIGLHGGLIPLCTTAFLRPDLVKPGKFGALRPEQSETALNYGLLDAYSKDGCWGEPIEVAAGDLSRYAKMGSRLWTTFAKAQAERIQTVLQYVVRARAKLRKP